MVSGCAAMDREKAETEKQVIGDADDAASSEPSSGSAQDRASSGAVKWTECQSSTRIKIFGDEKIIFKVPQIHSYSAFSVVCDEVEHAYEFPISPAISSFIKEKLGTERSCWDSFILAIQRMHSGGINFSSPAALKPHWVLMNGITMYSVGDKLNQSINATVNCRAKVYEINKSGAALAKNINSIAKDIPISVHTATFPTGGEYMTLSSNTHHLGFGADQISRSVLWSVWFKKITGGIGTAATSLVNKEMVGLTLVLNEVDYFDFDAKILGQVPVQNVLSCLPCVMKHEELQQILQLDG
jgi:hypothetical protein